MSKWDGKEKGKAINKTGRGTNLSDKYSGYNEKKQTSTVTLIDSLSRNCRQTHTLPTDKDTNLDGPEYPREWTVELCEVMKQYAGEWDQVRIMGEQTERGIKCAGHM